MPSLRTKSISTKVTDEEYAQFEASAGEQTISEWARDVLLKATKPNASEQTVLAEVLALRTILLKRPLRFITRANADRRGHAATNRAGGPEQVEQARERLAEAATGGMP